MSAREFYVWVDFYRYDEYGNRVAPTRGKKTCLAVESLKVERGLTHHDQATIRFSDGTHVGPFPYDKWDPRSRPAKVAANYERWRYSLTRS